MRLLLVDDDVDEALAIKDLLGREGLAVDVATTTDAALVSLDEAPPNIVLSALWIPPLTGLSLQAEVARRCPTALRLMLLSHPELAAAIGLVEEGETLRFLARPWCAQAVTTLLWRFVSDQTFLTITGDGPSQGLSVEALCRELPNPHVAPPLTRAPPLAGAAAGILGGALVRHGATARLVTEFSDGRRKLIDVPCQQARVGHQVAA